MTDFTRKYSRKNFCEKENNVGFVRSKSIIRIYVKRTTDLLHQLYLLHQILFHILTYNYNKMKEAKQNKY